MLYNYYFKKLIVVCFFFCIKQLNAHEPFVWVSILDDNINLYNENTSYSCKDLYLHALASFAHVTKGSAEADVHAILLYDGNDDNFVKVAKSFYNVEIIYTKFSLAGSPQFKQHDLAWQKSASATYMRFDAVEHIRNLSINCSYALVTDVDIIFVKDPRNALENLKPEKFCACPEEPIAKFIIFGVGINYFNNGIVWLNVKYMHNILPSLKNYILSKNFNIYGAFDQGAFNEFCNDSYQNFRLDKLPATLNWKAYWGANPEAIIVHFHAPKPDHYEKYLQWYDTANNPASISPEEVARLIQFRSQHAALFVRLMRFSSAHDLRQMVDLYHRYDLKNILSNQDD